MDPRERIASLMGRVQPEALFLQRYAAMSS